MVTVVLFLLAGLAGFIALRLFKKGSPPTPDLAIEEAKLHARAVRGRSGSSATRCTARSSEGEEVTR